VTNTYHIAEPWLLPIRSGSKLKVNHVVSSFFRKFCGLNLNLKRIRSLYETELKKAYEAQLVTHAQREAASRTTGHGPKARDRYYCRADRYIFILTLSPAHTLTISCMNDCMYAVIYT
jgi:hypothetical protein